jgi:hypothetical protein
MIFFYDPRDPYGFFSNFSRHPVTIYGRTWRTSEHAFQAMKFNPHRPDLVAVVWEAPTPGKAAELGRNRSFPINDHWDHHELKMLINLDQPEKLDLFPNDELPRPGVHLERCISRLKDLIMYEVVYAKFTQNEELRKELLATEDQAIIENAIHDPYWGCGSSQVGENKLGRILMTLRGALMNGVGRPLVLNSQ